MKQITQYTDLVCTWYSYSIYLCVIVFSVAGPSHSPDDEIGKSWDILDIMNNVSSVHSCGEHQNQQCGLGAAFDSLTREK